MTSTFLDYCPKCYRKTEQTNVRIAGGWNTVCQVCQTVTDQDFDDEYDEPHFGDSSDLE